MTKRKLLIALGTICAAAMFAGCGGGDDNPAGANGNTEDYVEIAAMTPSDGVALSIDQAGDWVELEIQFNRPVVAVGAILVPSLRWLDQDWLFRSADSTTYSREVWLESDEVYQFILFGALGADSTVLREPQLIAFTTGGELPTASISGHARTPQSYGANGTVLILVDAMHWIPGLEFEGNDLESHIKAFGFISDAGGDYTIENVKPGKYYMYAFKDVTSDGVVQDGDDLFGMYGGLYTGLEVIDVREDQETTDIDFDLYKGSGFF